MHSWVSDHPVLVVPLCQIVPGLRIELTLPLGSGPNEGLAEARLFLAPESSYTGGWALELPELHRSPECARAPDTAEESGPAQQEQHPSTHRQSEPEHKRAQDDQPRSVDVPVPVARTEAAGSAGPSSQPPQVIQGHTRWMQ